MISYGDSYSYSAIWNYYVACDTCIQYDSLESTSDEYKLGRHLKIMSSGKLSTLMDLWIVIVL